MRTSL
jgi:hypothetical protein